MKPSTSLGTRSNVGIVKPSPAVRQTGNMRCLLVMGGVYRSSVLSGGTQVKYRCRCRDKCSHTTPSIRNEGLGDSQGVLKTLRFLRLQRGQRLHLWYIGKRNQG